MMVEVLLGFVSIVCLVQLYVNWNLLNKVELLETWVEDFSDRISKVQQELTEIDSTGHFEADDEIGTIFTSIKEVVNDISNFTNKESFSDQK
tara:strand:+ start:112 stop:387 length:276 start_codon:yes stop_codon:yes gene_type:complete